MDENTIQQTNQKSPIPPVTPTPPQPIPPASSKKNSGVLIGILLLLLGILVGLAIDKTTIFSSLRFPYLSATPTPTPFSTPTPPVDPTANWKTYTNSQYGYTVKYPSNISFKQDRFYFTGDDNRKDTADGFGPNLSIYYRGSDISPSQVALKEFPNAKLKDVVINNATGVQTETTDSPLYGFNYFLKSPSGKNVMWLFFSPQSYSQTVSKDKIQEMETIATQILSTFKFTQTITPTPTQSSIPSKALYYSVPSGWKTAQDSTSSFAVSYDPATSKVDTNTSNGLFLLRQRPEPALGYYGCESVNIYPYDGGSRHLFINKYLGETPTKSELFSDYKETEYLYNGKSCLVLNGISISQFNSVWGMCDIGSGKAFLFTSCDRDSANYEKVLQTIQVLK